ncbi:putative transcriptional regulatory protein [Neolecta irregularis DAH-3]|uniref:Putative transcriptional regulatory protein n=1 Tax=Neolecta irregularis (strain DAH-3) TaxID=1198029 RepID=A0A1U7LWC0_NEOID|nr:putative transcriptional regulatory protein [Neolecta irregularis DAH-3]|eukprot:OLL26975.1 putative transcriptional regulatory protein [Neolecta irregularis DAH-3]
MEIDRLNLPSGSDDPGSHQQFDTKRNKITRACDLCRKRKVKCDGFSPCASCLHNDMPCTFIDEPKKYPQKGPKYVQSLEERLERMESLIKELVPNMATEIDLIVGNSKRAEKTRHSSPRESLIQESPRSDLSNNRSKDKGPEMIKEITVVEALSDSFDGLLLKEDGCSTRYIGSHSIVSMFSEAGEQVQKYLPNRDIMSDLAKGLSNARSSQVKYDHTAMFALLPSRNVADIFVKYFLEITNVISPMFHASAFLEEFENSWKDANTMMDPVWLGTYLTVLAVGAQLYAVEQGLSLRKELEIMSSKWSDAVWNMQNELVMIRNYKAVRCLTLALIYMPVHTNPRPCWVALGMIVQSSLLVGLHRHGEGWNFNPIESQERRVTFWTIYMLDKYFSSVVGLPSILQDDDIDQRLPYEADYNCITKDGIFPGENTCSKQLKMFIHLIKIAQIQSKIQKKVYRVIRTDKDIEIMNDHVITIDNEVTAV